MIGTFWNICRACPALPTDKPNSEYRSTYRWPEMTGCWPEVIRRPPQDFLSGCSGEPAFPRRKKHPELAYRTHEFLSDDGTRTLLSRSYERDRGRCEEKWALYEKNNSRRSKSEDRHPNNSLNCSVSVNKTPNSSCTFIKAEKNHSNRRENKSSSDSARPLGLGRYYNIRKNEFSSGNNEGEKVNTSQPPSNFQLNDIVSSHKKFTITMNGTQNKEFSNPQETVPVHGKKTGESSKKKQSEQSGSQHHQKPENESIIMKSSGSKYPEDDVDGEPKSEYKKNFQPFNRYEYDEQKGIFEKKTTLSGSDQNSTQDGEPRPLSSWYREVVLLRQKANQYRHRGWGTELIPEHIAQLYSDQILVWEQVSRRSTLSALSLATTVNCRDQSPARNQKENRKITQAKSLTRVRSARGTSQPAATHQTKAEKNPNNAAAAGGKEPGVESRHKKGNTQVKKLEVKRTSTNRTNQESGVVGNQSTHLRPVNPGSEKSKRRPRPTSLVATVPSGSKTIQSKIKGRKGKDVDEFSLDYEQIVKTPPEPTRVKSPEQIVIRSPEPVNWTVPLDTGKTFTVTQNIREGELNPRSSSEARAWTSASVSAPPELEELAKVPAQEEILTK